MNYRTAGLLSKQNSFPHVNPDSPNLTWVDFSPFFVSVAPDAVHTVTDAFGEMNFPVSGVDTNITCPRGESWTKSPHSSSTCFICVLLHGD